MTDIEALTDLRCLLNEFDYSDDVTAEEFVERTREILREHNEELLAWAKEISRQTKKEA